MTKKVSLLVTTYNVKNDLAVTLAGIEQQDYAPIEVVIVDGGSCDGTVDIIREFAERHPEREQTEGDRALTVRWITEPDKGLYDAMNKAWAMCSGDIVAVCNDRLCTADTVTKLVGGDRTGR